MELIGCIGVPDDEFTVLGGRNEVPSVCCPMHGVDFGKMTFEGTSGFHGNSR